MQFSSFIQISSILVAAHAQQLTHPFLPNGIHKDLDFDGDLIGFLESPKGSQYTITPWSNSALIPKACFDAAQELAIMPTSIEVRDITYGDCEEAWTLCRVDSINATWEDIAKVRFVVLEVL